MTTWKNGFVGQTAGAAVTTGNSAASGDGFTYVSTGGTCQYAASTVSGFTTLINVAYSAASAATQYTERNVFGTTQLSDSFYFDVPASLPSATTQIYSVRSEISGVAAQAWGLNYNTNGKIQLLDAAGSGTGHFLSAAALVASTRVRIDIKGFADATLGTVDVGIYDSTDALIETHSDTGLNTRGGTITNVRQGKVTGSAWTGTVAMGQISGEGNRTTFMGPWTLGYDITLGDSSSSTDTGDLYGVDRTFTFGDVSGSSDSATGFNAGGGGSGGDFAVTVQEGNVPPRVRLEVNNSGGPTVYITRTGPDGVAVPVREADPATTSSNQIVVYDYEAPFNQPVTYTAGTVVATPVTVHSSTPWLIHPGIPTLSQPVFPISPISDETKESPAGTHQIVGRRDPIIITDGTRKSPVFTLAVMTSTQDEETAFDQLIYDTAPLLLQIVQPGTARQVYRWVSVGTAVISVPGAFSDPTRIWSLQCTEIAPPVGGIQAQRTYADLLVEAASYAPLLGMYTTYRGVLVGELGT